jgi:hypothetical protein
MPVRQHHDVEAAVWQHAQIAGVAAPPASMGKAALATIARDLEAEAIVYLTKF